MPVPSVARRIVLAAADTDVGAVRWLVPMRCAIVTTSVIGVLLALGDTAASVPAGIGALCTAVGDSRGTAASRAKGMAWVAVWVSVACALGVLASDWSWVRIGATVVVAFAFGYAGRISARAGLVGLLSLIVFLIFAGAPTPLGSAIPAGLLVLAGGAIQLVAGVLPQIAGRTGGVRGDICVAYRAVGSSLHGGRIRYGGTSPVLKLERARQGVAAMHADAAVREPFEALLDALDDLRMGGLIVLALPLNGTREDRVRVDAFVQVSARLVRALGHAIEMPIRTHAVGPLAAAMEQAAAACDGLTDARVAVGIRQMRSGMREAVAVVHERVPRGGMRSVPLEMAPDIEPLHTLIGRATLHDVMLRHAIRLAIATGIGTAIAVAAGFPHNYWIPMTVAWVLRPDLAGTGVRVTGRVTGTIIGLLLSAVVIGLFGNGLVAVVALLLASTLLVYVFLVPNYAICTVGITGFVIALFSFLGDPLLPTIGLRILGTLIAGLLAMAVVTLIPARSTEVLCGVLASTAEAVSRYAQSVRRGNGPEVLVSARRDVAGARLTAGQVVDSATLEVGRHRVAPEHAEVILRDLVQAAAVIAVTDLGGDPDAARHVPERAVDEAADLAARLRARQADETVPARALPPPAPDAPLVLRILGDAQSSLDDALRLSSATTA